MQIDIQYLTDTKGNKVAVQMPLKDWNKLWKDYNKLRQYHRLKKGLSESFQEIREIENGDQQPVTLAEFLNEC